MDGTGPLDEFATVVGRTVPAAPPIALRISHVTVRYGASLALDDVCCEIPAGSLTAVLGPNGAGKTTLLRSVLGWQRLAGGEIVLNETQATHASPRLAYLPQNQSVDWDFPITVREVVEQGRYPALGLFRRLGLRDRETIARALEELGLAELADRQIRMLSGGQQRRVFLARALAQGAEIFLLDEPFAGLDLFATEELTHILRAWEAQGRTVLAAVHDLALARRSFGRGLLLDSVCIAAGPISEVLSEANIDRAFRRGHCVHA